MRNIHSEAIPAAITGPSRTIYNHLLSAEKKQIATHTAKCEGCNKFKFKTDLRPYFLPGYETTEERLMLCTYCRGHHADLILQKTADIFGVTIEVVDAMMECLKSSKRNSDAKNGKKAHSISLDDILRIWLIQDGKCSLSGVKLELEGDDLTHPSIDRIDSRHGYRMGNIQLVTRYVNLMKTDLPQDIFIMLCGQIASHKKDQKSA